MNKVIVGIGIFMLTMLLTGCFGPRLYVANDRVPFLVSKESAFATKTDLMKLTEGEKVEFINPVSGRYYVPLTFIDIFEEDGVKYIKLKE